MSTYTCTITIDKDAGITLVVEDKDNSSTQSITMTKDSIICEVKGEKTSTITQTADTVTIEVEKFELKADEVTVSAKKTIDMSTQSDSVTIDSGKDLTAKAAAKGTWSCADGDFSGSSSWKHKAPTIAIEADTKLSGKSGATLALEGAQVTMKGSATLGLESSGSTTVKGSMVQVSAPMIKLG